MRIETLSIRAVTISIFIMIGLVAIVLSILAGGYFKQAALNAQMSSLSRVIEVASQEMLKEVRAHTFDLGMKLGHNNDLNSAVKKINMPGGKSTLIKLLDDPFINGFAGFSNINLEKIRIFNLDLELIVESSEGIKGLDKKLDMFFVNEIGKRQGIDRLKAIDALWMSQEGPMYSTMVPMGGLRLVGYIEILVDPVFNLPDIGKITQTPISVYSMSGEPISIDKQKLESSNLLPIRFTLNTTDRRPAFHIIGYENVGKLNKEMEKTQVVTISGFLVLSLITLIIALWLFNRFLFLPLRKMIYDMKQVTRGRMDLTVSEKGLREFNILAETFNSMANQVRMHTNDLERILDMDDSAIVCFGKDDEAVYFNKSATELYGYTTDEIVDLDASDLFVENIQELMSVSNQSNVSDQNKLYTQLNCISNDGQVKCCEAVISLVDSGAEDGYAIVLSSLVESMLNQETQASDNEEEQRIDMIEQSLNSLLEMAKNNPNLLSGLANLESSKIENSISVNDKAKLREHAVTVMLSALSCWEHDLGKSKLALAEESKIWPVYIDKSTPTTRTLDKYLNIESCPKNPRSQRVVDTAEFVLREMNKEVTLHSQKLEEELKAFRLCRSGA